MEKLEKDQPIYREAAKDDCQQIAALINFFAKKEAMLSKSEAEIMTMVPCFFVAEFSGQVIANVGFKVWLDSKVEIISLATHPEFQGAGIGSTMLGLCMEKIVALGFWEIFTLTVAPKFFIRHGFKPTEHRSLQSKIYADCRWCPRNAGGPDSPRCNEVALVFDK